MGRMVALALMLALALTLALWLVGPAWFPAATGEEPGLDPYVSHPANIPNLHDFSTPQLAPGESGTFELQVTNRYMAPMENVTLEAEIYMRADVEASEPIEQVSSPPRIKEAKGAGMVGEQYLRWRYDTIASNASQFPAFTVATTERTDEGTYFVRFALDFDYNDTHRVMKSRGHWNESQWEAATTDVEPGSPGNLNLTGLEVDGIIPDSSFGVKGGEGKGRLPSINTGMGVAAVAAVALAWAYRQGGLVRATGPGRGL